MTKKGAVAAKTAVLKRRTFTREFKLYAPGVGLVKEGSLELVSYKYVQ